MKKIKGYAALAAIALVAIVILQNTQAVETKVLFMTIVMPRAALLAVTLLIGIAAGVFFGWKFSRPKSSPSKPTK